MSVPNKDKCDMNWISCTMLKIGRRMTLFVKYSLVGVIGGRGYGCIFWTCSHEFWADIEINSYKLISISTTYYTTPKLT